MNLWAKIAFTVLVVAGPCMGQTLPADSPSSASTIAPTTAADLSASGPTLPVPGATLPAKPAPCPLGAPAICVAQMLRGLMVNPDGTHRADADIATDFARAIGQFIKDGMMKPQDAPPAPISGFDDASKFVESYLGGQAGSAQPAGGAVAPPKPAPCPADRPWLCEIPVTSATAQAPKTQASTTPAAKGPAKPPGAAPGTTPGNGPATTAAVPAKGKAAKRGAAGGATPAPPSADVPLYVLGANDVVGVQVVGERDVSSTYAIGPDGRISMPLIGNFKATGMTEPQLGELITQKLKDDGGILEPVVNVQLLRSNSKQFTLIGGVGRAGPVPLLRETTILDALAAAGFKEFANKKKIVLRRGTKEFHFNYAEVIKGVHMEQNIVIQDGDLIIVPE